MKSKFTVEFLGTFAVLFFGCGSILVSNLYSLPPFLIPVLFGLSVSVMIYSVGHISGAHFNPAVTFAFTVARHFPLKQLPLYWLAQVLGAILAIILLKFIFPANDIFLGTVPKIELIPALAMEFIITFFLMFVIIAVATDTRAEGTMAGIAIGCVVALGAFIAGPLTGGSMNPARSLAPALVHGHFEYLWIYMVSPLLGAMVAALLYEKIRCDVQDEKNKSAKGCC